MEQDEIIEMARRCGFERLGHDDCDLVCYPEEVEAFAKLVAAKEREACAKEADKWSKRDDDAGAFIGKAIRARGEA